MKVKLFFTLLVAGVLGASAQGYQDGVDNYNAGRLDVAKTILGNTINDPATNKAVAYYYLGNIDFSEGNVAQAKPTMKRVRPLTQLSPTTLWVSAKWSSSTATRARLRLTSSALRKSTKRTPK